MSASNVIVHRRRSTPAPCERRVSNPAGPLRWAARAWFSTAALGQLAFSLYVGLFYGLTALNNGPRRWNEIMNKGYVPGDTTFNAVLALHLGMAVAITLGGLLQLVPGLRRAAPAFHRWNGRLYLLLSLAMAVGGLTLIWIRGGAAGDRAQHVGTSLNALVIVGCAAATWWQARTGRPQAHRRWALRLFLAVSGVWFFRIGLMLWIVLNQGPVGFDPDRFTGPFLTGLSFAQWLLPLVALEGYLRATRHAVWVQWSVAVLLMGLALVTLAGSGAATAILWLPPLRHAMA